MKIISLFLGLRIIQSQLQLNLIQGQPFFYSLEKQFDTNGYNLQTMSSDLGLSIQGGFTQGPLNTNINVTQIVSTSLLEEFNLIAFLKSIGQLYLIELVQYDYHGIIGTPQTLFNITSVNQTCQDIEILQYLNIIVHCINTTNNQIQIYNYNDTIITTNYFNINLTNYTQVLSVDIQPYYNMEQYDLYFVYITKLSSFIYNTTLSNNTYSLPQQVWTYNSSFLQIFISNEQEIFALQFNYLLYQYQGQQTNYSSQNKSNWIAMTIQFDYKGDFLIYLVNNYTITELFFLDQFYLIDEQFLPIQINSAQMLSTYDNVYVLTPQYVLIYGFEDGEYLVFSQFSKNNLINTNNIISSQQNIIISFASAGTQIYQLLDYALVTQNPQNSGYLVINFYNMNGSLIYNQTLYIYLLSSYQNQIMPTVYGLYQISYSPQNPYFIDFNIGQYYVGSNISYYLNSSNLSGTSQFSKYIENITENYNCDTALVSALNEYNSFLYLCGKGEYLQFSAIFIDEQPALTQFETNKFAFIGLSGEGDIFLAFSYQTIYVYYVYIDMYFDYQYSINLSSILNVTAFVVKDYVVIDNNIFLQLNQSYVILGIYQTYFRVIEIGNQTFTQVSGNSYNQNYLFVTNSNSLDIYVWYEDGLQLQESSSYQNFGDFIEQVFVYPLIDGLFVLAVDSNQTTYLSFFDKLVLNGVNLGYTLLISVDTSNFTLNQSSTAYSGVYFYIHAIQNNKNYINIYQINQQQIGALKQSKWFSTIPQNITVSSDLIAKIDYMSVYYQEGYTVFPINHNDNIYQFPNFQVNPSYEYINNIVLNNSYSQALVELNININQLFVYVENNYLNTTINGNLSNGSIIVNPYDYFSGAIQGYNISCNNCSSIHYQSIISNQYLYYNAPTQFSLSYQQNNSYQLYLSNLLWTNYTQVSSNIDLTNQPLNLTTIAYYPEDYQLLIGIFLEINTNAITWVLLNESTYYICTILPNTSQIINITIPGLEKTNIQYILYNDGYLQILQENDYSCFYYQIVNQSQLLTTIVSLVNIQQVNAGVIFTFLNIETTSNYSIFGSLSQTATSTVFSFILNVTQVANNSFVLNYFNIQYLQQLDYFQYLFPIQYMQQFGNVIYENGIYIIMLAYTTQVNSGIIQLEIKDYQVLNLQKKCSLQLLNQQSQNLMNMMDLNQSQIAILQQTEENVSSIILTLYYVDQYNCNYEQTIQPYTYQVFDNQRQDQSINYLNQNNFLLSINGQTFIYEINNFINVEFNSSQNSSIQVTAYNNLYNQSQLINIYYTEPQQVIINTKHSFAWYRGYHPEIPAYLHIQSLSSFHLSFKNLPFNKSFQSSIKSPPFIQLFQYKRKLTLVHSIASLNHSKILNLNYVVIYMITFKNMNSIIRNDFLIVKWIIVL